MKYKIKIRWSEIIKYIRRNSESIPEEPGVYEILVKQSTGRYKRRYVGQTDDLKRRFLEHLSEDEPNEYIKKYLEKYNCGFDYALLHGENDRKDVERTLYYRYREEIRCNNITPEGSGRDYYIILEEVSPY